MDRNRERPSCPFEGPNLWACVFASVGAVAVLGGVGGCVRDAAPAICPDLQVGDLVITEVRGPQTRDDALGQWVELHNRSGAAQDLLGLQIRWRRIDGSRTDFAIIRREVAVENGGYVVIGAGPDADLPAHIDVGMGNDLPTGVPPSAAIDVLACDQLIDRITYTGLTRTGTYSLALQPPDAVGNDSAAAWCNNSPANNTEVGPGSPGVANPPCD